MRLHNIQRTVAQKCSLVDEMVIVGDSAPCGAVGPQDASGIEDEDMFMFQATLVWRRVFLAVTLTIHKTTVAGFSPTKLLQRFRPMT